MHLDLDNAVAAAGFTPAALYIKAETSLGIALCFGVGSGRKQIADQIEHPRISCRIRPGRSSDRGLIDGYDFIKQFYSFNSLVFSRNCSGAVQFLGQGFIQNLIHQRALARTGHSGHTGHHAQWEGNVCIL